MEDYPKEIGPYLASVVECPICTYSWVACWPKETKELQCPHCEHLSEPIIKNQ